MDMRETERTREKGLKIVRESIRERERKNERKREIEREEDTQKFSNQKQAESDVECERNLLRVG